MTLRFLTTNLSRFFDVRAGDAARIGLMAAFLFFLLAANNVIKIVRDSLFLSRFPTTQLPYVYLLVALLAGVVIGIYSRLYLPIPDLIKKKVKVFVDVTVERLGDGIAAFIILFCTFFFGKI